MGNCPFQCTSTKVLVCATDRLRLTDTDRLRPQRETFLLNHCYVTLPDSIDKSSFIKQNSGVSGILLLSVIVWYSCEDSDMLLPPLSVDLF